MASTLEDSVETGPPLTNQSNPPKRKGTRKPLYITSEERRQRNRQAQTAFRERRSKYIKLLEESVQRYEVDLQNLHVNHRVATDQYQMLRYKNALLLSVLVEKGIDINFEISAMTDKHYEQKDPRQDKTVDQLAFQYHSTPVELLPTTISFEHSLYSNDELLSPGSMAFCSGQLHQQGITPQKGIEFPPYDEQDMGDRRIWSLYEELSLPLQQFTSCDLSC